MFHRVVRKWHKSFKKSICEQLMMRLVALLCLSLLLVGGHSQKTHRDEVNALRSINRSLIDHYKVLRNWNKGDPCTSNWTGIICYNSTLEDGYLHIRELLLLNSNLSGSLSPEIGRLSYLKILDFMWNNISGIIPKEIGNITTLELLLLNGNKLSGTLPEEIGNLSNLDRLQVDENEISGPLPLSLAKLSLARHFHMNNNSLSGDIPPDLHRLPNLVHLLLDNNNLSGSLPPELSEMPSLRILQLDNNNFDGSTIPSSYGNMSRLLKLSLRNCNLQGVIPNWSNMISVANIDLSLNRLSGSIPTDVLSENITTIDLSNNMLNGSVPLSFSSLPHLQKLSLTNNSLSGTISSSIWQKRTLNSSERLILDFENNMFANISGSTLTHPNTTVGFTGNPLCSNANLIRFCGPQKEDFDNINVTNLNNCLPQSCPPPYAYAPESAATHCFCAAPIYIGYRMKSPSFSDFLPYVDAFKQHLSSALDLNFYQVDIDSVAWQEGPRLRMYLKIFPPYANDSMRMFNKSEVVRILEMFGGWKIRHNELFGPFEFLNFTLSDPYKDEFHPTSASGISKGAIVGIAIAAIFGSVIVSAFVSFLISRRYIRKHHSSSRRHSSSRISVTIDGVKEFAYDEMKLATNDFRGSNMVGQGGYGKVYRGILSDGSVVAIKRAQDGSLQGEREFLTEIQLLSRLHHKNLVSLVGYCDEEGEQMLIYEFMSNGTLRDHLSGKSKSPLSFVMRVRIALDTARGILYLHTEANPPIFHRDIKATNILLDAKYTAKVADFGLSRLAPDPTIEGAVPDHVSTLVKGTPGYLDPEYFLTHKLTDKSDVYSLGVVFMELLTGMQPIFRGKNLVREVSSAYQSGTIFSIIDERMGSYPSECIFKFVNLSRRCCNEETESRPSMSEVVRELESILLMLPADSDTESAYTVSRCDRESAVIASSSSSSLIRSYLSENASDLMSGVIPSISPR